MYFKQFRRTMLIGVVGICIALLRLLIFGMD